jgi:hypothetical protein
MLYIITFPSTYQALNFEKKYKETGLSFILRPVPREISSSCGIAAQLQIEEDKIDSFWQQLHENNIEADGLYAYSKKNNKVNIIPIIKGQV